MSFRAKREISQSALAESCARSLGASLCRDDTIDEILVLEDNLYIISLIICIYSSPSLYRNIIQPHLRQVQMGLSLSIYRYARRLFHQYLDGRAIAHAEKIESLLDGSDTYTVGVVDRYHGHFICQW